MNNIMLKIILPIFGIVAILGFITWLSPIKQQDASTTIWNTSGQPSTSGEDTCGDITVFGMADATAGNSYMSTISLRSNSATKGYTITYLYQSYWCGPNNTLGDGVNPTSCVKNERSSGSVQINVPPASSPNNTVILYSPNQTSSDYGYTNLCGVFQTDFSYVVNGTTCHFGYSADDQSPNHPVMAASYLNTNTTCQVPTPTSVPTPTNAPTPTAVPSATPTPTSAPTATPVPPTPTGTSTNTNNCGDTTQVGVNGSNNNNNCNQNNNQNNNNNNNSQSQSQTQNNNQSVNITLNSQQPQQQQQQQQQVLAASTGPKELPETGAASDVIFGLLALIPVGWKIRKLV